MTLQGSITERVEAPAPDVFALVTDIDRLPEWNAIITDVVQKPAALEPGAEWVVALHAIGTSWNSRSQVIELDPAARRFVHRSQSDDGNPSFAIWTWSVDEAGGGASVTVAWELNPKTFWRRTLLAQIRNRQLRHEVHESVGRIAHSVQESKRTS